jgi:hypothetical protein
MTTTTDAAPHRQWAIDLFNLVWTLLETPNRTAADSERMLHAAHASRYHSGVVGTGKQWAIGEWQISRVYAVLNRAEPAWHHGQRALELAQEHAIGPFYVGYGYEALARAHAVAGNRAESQRFLDLARKQLPAVTDEEERKMLADDLAAVAAI